VGLAVRPTAAIRTSANAVRAAHIAKTPPYPSIVSDPNPMIGPDTIAPSRRVFVFKPRGQSRPRDEPLEQRQPDTGDNGEEPGILPFGAGFEPRSLRP
jgi:hypothetical protein